MFAIWFFVFPGFFGRSSARSVPFPPVSSPASAGRRLPLLSDHSRPFSSAPETPTASPISSSAESEQRRDCGSTAHASAERLGPVSPPTGDQYDDVDGRRRYGRNVDHDHVCDLPSARREGDPHGERAAAPPAPPPQPTSSGELPSTAARNSPVQLRPADLPSLHRRLATVAAANLQKAKENRHRARVNYACTGSALAISTTLFIWQNHLSRDSGLVLELGSKSAAIFGLLLADQLIRIGTELLWRGAKGRQRALGCMMYGTVSPERRVPPPVVTTQELLLSARRSSFAGRAARGVKNWFCVRRCFRAERVLAGDEASGNGEGLDASRSRCRSLAGVEEVVDTDESLCPQEQALPPTAEQFRTLIEQLQQQARLLSHADFLVEGGRGSSRRAFFLFVLELANQMGLVFLLNWAGYCQEVLLNDVYGGVVASKISHVVVVWEGNSFTTNAPRRPSPTPQLAPSPNPLPPHMALLPPPHMWLFSPLPTQLVAFCLEWLHFQNSSKKTFGFPTRCTPACCRKVVSD